MATAVGWIDETFAARLGVLLAATRRARGLSLSTLSRRSTLSRHELKAAEHGALPLGEDLVRELAAVYQADLDGLVSGRRAVDVDITGVISVGPSCTRFDPIDDVSLLTAYLRLVREVRRQQHDPVVALRRDDVEALAAFLCLPGEEVVEQLCALMGVTQQHRRTMIAMFVAGAAVIGLVGGASLSASASPSRAGVPPLRPGRAPLSTPLSAPLQTSASNATRATTAEVHDSIRAPAVVATTPAEEPVPAVPEVPAATAPVAAVDGELAGANSAQNDTEEPAGPELAETPEAEAQPVRGDGEGEREVAVGLPPVPPDHDGEWKAPDPEERVVAVGLPPVPPNGDES